MSGIRAITIRKKKKNSRNMKPDEEQIKAIFNKVLNNQTLDKVLSLVGIEDCCESTFKSMTEEDTVKLFVNTLPTLKGERPGRNEAWLLRITASRIYAIYTCTKKTNTCWKQKSTKFFWPKTFTNQYVRHGIENQKLATETYESKEKVKVVQCGFIVHPKHQWTGVSPDGLVFGESGPEKLIEIKCLFAGKQKSINECLSSCEYLEKKNDKCDIKKKHPCYGQIQLGMLLCNVKECDFILFASFDQSIKVISVPFDEEFALEMFTVVRDTYFNKMLEYICRHKKRHQDQREGASSMAKKRKN